MGGALNPAEQNLASPADVVSRVCAAMYGRMFRMHYYNTRDVLPRCETARNPKVGQTCWPAPELEANLNTEELGDLGLTDHDEDALVAFLETLSDD